MSARIETAKRFIESFGTLDGNEMTRLKTSDCLHHFAPATLGINEPKSTEEFSNHLSTLRDVLAGFPVYIKELWDKGNNVTIWATSETKFHEAAMDSGLPSTSWAFNGEYIFILEMNEAGDKITRVVEFLDSKATEELRALFKRARTNLGLSEKRV